MWDPFKTSRLSVSIVDALRGLEKSFFLGGQNHNFGKLRGQKCN